MQTKHNKPQQTDPMKMDVEGLIKSVWEKQVAFTGLAAGVAQAAKEAVIIPKQAAVKLMPSITSPMANIREIKITATGILLRKLVKIVAKSIAKQTNTAGGITLKIGSSHNWKVAVKPTSGLPKKAAIPIKKQISK